MDFYKKYGITDFEIKWIKEMASPDLILEAETHQAKIGELFDYLKELGITSFGEIFLYKPEVIYYTKEEMKNIIEKSDVPNIVSLLQDEIENFELLGF